MVATEHVVAREDEIPEGGMKGVEIGKQRIVLIRHGGELVALGGTCPHAGAPLAKGALCNGKLICPWHKGTFRIADGALLEPPARDSLPRYPLRVEEGQVVVTLEPQPLPPQPLPPPPMSDEPGPVAIIGAGAAGSIAAETLRREGYTGRILLISHEARLPYDRTLLSKMVLAGQMRAADGTLRDAAYYEHHRIERLTAEVTALDAGARRVTLADGRHIDYRHALLATGGVPRRLDVPGADLSGVQVLRTPEDVDHIVDGLQEGSRVVIIGASFIGLEAASALRQRKQEVTVVAPDKVPFAKQFGEELGDAIRRLHEKNGVLFHLESEVERIEGDSRAETVVLKGGTRLPADRVLVGIGVRPVTEFAQGVNRHKDGGILVDSELRAAPCLFAAGDIAAFPYGAPRHPLRIEHWRVAEQQGRLAARNILGGHQSFNEVPFFWTFHFGNRFGYLGHAESWDEIIIDGDPAKPRFIAFYAAKGQVLAALGCKRDHDMAWLAERMRTPLPRAELPGLFQSP